MSFQQQLTFLLNSSGKSVYCDNEDKVFILAYCSHLTEYIMRNTGLEETQARIKIAGRNINNLRHADNTTLMAESEGN